MHPQVRALVRDLDEDRLHGAAHLARRAAAAFVFLAKKSGAETSEGFRAEVEETAQALLAAQPSVASILHLCAQVKQATADPQARQAVRRAVVRFGDWVAADTARLVEHAAVRLGHVRVVGAFGASGTVARVLGSLEEVTRVLWQGPGEEPPPELARLRRALDITSEGPAEVLLVGADAIAWQGVLNVRGTREMVEGTPEPAFVVADGSKLLPASAGPVLPLKEGPGGGALLDLTPLEAFEGVITGRGAMRGAQVRELLRAVHLHGPGRDLIEEAGQ